MKNRKMYKSLKQLNVFTCTTPSSPAGGGAQERSATPMVPQQAVAASAPGDPSLAALPSEHLLLDQPSA